MTKRASAIRGDADCKVCGNLRAAEDLHPCERCHKPVCMRCVVLHGPPVSR